MQMNRNHQVRLALPSFKTEYGAAIELLHFKGSVPAKLQFRKAD